MKQHKWLPIFVLVLLAALLTPIRARADMAPPQQPPGTNIVPGSENTQVRMVAETVTLIVLATPDSAYKGQAATTAVFTMRNLGTETETMDARFPLTFWNGKSDGHSRYPEISDITIEVDGEAVSTHRIDVDYAGRHDPRDYRTTPWAAFNITFPPQKDVIVKVKYTTNGYGEGGFFDLRYILETGAGWNGTIGSADVIVKLPYLVTEENVLLTGHVVPGWPGTTAGAKLSGDEVRWHFEDFEPTEEGNINLWLVTVARWRAVQQWRIQTQKTPNDGEAWGQLGLAIKRMTVSGREFVRSDQVKLYEEAAQAYQKSVTLLPNDALWHYGFADLLFHYYDGTSTDPDNMARLSHAVSELHQSLVLDDSDKNQQAKELASWINILHPWAIAKKGEDVYDYLILTATPTTIPPAATPSPSATSTPANTLDASPQPTLAPTDTAALVSPTKSPVTGSPVCGGAALTLLPGLAVFWLAKRKR